MSLTLEQQETLHYIQENEGIVKIEAVAGSGKTFTLRKIAALFERNCLYLAYNKSIATEAQSKFPSYVSCKTTHSLAYYPVVVAGIDVEGDTGVKRKVGIFNYRNIVEEIPYEDKLEIVSVLNSFFLSKYTSLLMYCDEVLGMDDNDEIYKLSQHYFNEMASGRIEIPHSFYLKWYHICLAEGVIHYDEYECVMLDEAGDINAVTLEIFKLLPAKHKVMVGDRFQNIYGFNHTINGFKVLTEGATFTLSQSFRCAPHIAERIEAFCKQELKEDFKFTGTPSLDDTINTIGVLSRTNSSIIGYIIKMMNEGRKFSTIRDYKEIFGTVLALINLSKGKEVLTKELKHLNDDMRYYDRTPELHDHYKTVIGYIDAKYSQYDPDIKAAVNIIRTHTISKIWDAYFYTQKHGKENDKFILTTIHSSKGLEFDKVILSNDIKLDDILATPKKARTPQDIEELNLYYVACSRAKKVLDNAIYLPHIHHEDEGDNQE